MITDDPIKQTKKCLFIQILLIKWENIRGNVMLIKSVPSTYAILLKV